MDLFFTRSSVRKFENRPVEEEKIQEILKAAMAAPTACNQRAWHFYVVKNQEVIQELSNASPYAGPMTNAPVAIAVCYDKTNMPCPEYGDIDCAIASENIWLAAEDQGLGTVMLGIAPVPDRQDAVAKVLKLPENMVAFTLFPLGYPVGKQPQKNRYDASRIHVIE